MRGLRYIFRIDHSYYSHISNEQVLQQATIELNKCDSNTMTWEQFIADPSLRGAGGKEIKLVGEILKERQQVLLGHIIRRPGYDMIRRVTCDDNLVRPQQIYKRPGHPRSHWLEDNLQLAFTRLSDYPPGTIYDNTGPNHVQIIKQAAMDRKL